MKRDQQCKKELSKGVFLVIAVIAFTVAYGLARFCVVTPFLSSFLAQHHIGYHLQPFLLTFVFGVLLCGVAEGAVRALVIIRMHFKLNQQQEKRV